MFFPASDGLLIRLAEDPERRIACWSGMDLNRRSRLFRAQAAGSCQFRFSVSADRRVLNRTGERLASDSDQSDVYVCPKKERAGMKRNPSRSGTRSLADELAELRGLDLTALKQRWRVLYRTEAPSYRDGIAEFAAGLAKATDAKRSSGSPTSC